MALFPLPRDDDPAMKITKIESQKKRPMRRNIFANGEFLIGVGAETLLAFGLRTGDEISTETLRALEKTEEELGARNAALRFLSVRPRSIREVRDKLREKEFGDEEIAKTLAELTRAGLLDDDAFARAYVRNARVVRPAGKVLIRQKLVLFGVPKEILETALAEEFSAEEHEADAAKAAAGFLKKASAARRKEEPFKLKQRLTAFLLRRGYTWDVVAPVVKRMLPKGDLEDPAS
jgi:regulatory protein